MGEESEKAPAEPSVTEEKTVDPDPPVTEEKPDDSKALVVVESKLPSISWKISS